MSQKTRLLSRALFVCAAVLCFSGTWFDRPVAAQNFPTEATRVPVIFTHGHDIGRDDQGLPVPLLAGALKVPEAEFRSAMMQLRKSPGTEPDQWQLQLKHTYTLRALEKYGISTYRFGEVAKYYRYDRSRGELWPNTSAKAFAVIDHDRLVGFEVLHGGSGYSSAPSVSIPGRKDILVNVSLAYGPDFANNGSITSITLATPKKR